jgi:glutaredoxin
MESVKIFTRAQCPRCPAAKEVGKKLEGEGVSVFQYDLDTTDGLAEASFYSILSTPSLIIEDEQEREVVGWRGMVPTLGEVKQHLGTNPSRKTRSF